MGRCSIRAEQWYGEYGNVSLRAGTFAPPVFPALLPPRPNNPGVPYITNFLFTQPLSPNWVVFAGKKDVLGSFDQDIFAGGDGTEQFVNQSIIANPAFLLGLPYSSFTAGFVSPRKWGGFGAFVMDPLDRTADFMQVGNLFKRGIIMGGEVKVKTRFFDLPGQHHVGGVWKHEAQDDLRFSFLLPGRNPGRAGRRYAGALEFLHHLLWLRPVLRPLHREPGSRLGPVQPRGDHRRQPEPREVLPQRRARRLQPAWPELGATRSASAGSSWGPATSSGRSRRRSSGHGTGAAWSSSTTIQATPWLNITPDVQWLRPSAGDLPTDNAFVYGLRINITF